MNRLSISRKSLSLNIVLAAVWITVSMWVGWYATPLEHPDGFQSIGASFGDQIGQLSWPFVGSFEGFDKTWGYHWFGWPMLRSSMAGLFSFSPLGDALFLHGVRALTAILVARYIFRQYASVSASILACATILLQKGWFCSMAFLYRPETVAALLLWLAAEPLWNQRPWPKWRKAVSITALFLCPMMHPLAVAAGLWVVVLGLVKGRVVAKESWQALFLRWLLPSLVGVLCFVGYYAWDQAAYDQLIHTLQTMQLIKVSGMEVLKSLFGDAKNIFYVWPASILLLFSVAGVVQNKGHASEIFSLFAASSFVALGFAYLIVGGHPNVGHASLMTPFLGLWAAQVFVMPYGEVLVGKLVRFSSVLLVLFCTLPLLLVASAYAVKSPQSARQKATEVLSVGLAQTQGNVLIPIELWEAALKQPRANQERIQFSTFPNFASNDRRECFEQGVIERLRDGDILILQVRETTPQGGIDLRPWPRHAEYADPVRWSELASYDPVINSSIVLGTYERKEVVLGALKIFRYTTTK